MADKEVLERIISMLPEEFQDVYDDTIPEAKEIARRWGRRFLLLSPIPALCRCLKTFVSSITKDKPRSARPFINT